MKSLKPTGVVTGWELPGAHALMDRRRKSARVYAATLQMLLSDLAPDGDPSTQVLMLAQRAVTLNLRLLQIDTGFLRGKEINDVKYVSLVNALNGVLRTLGVQRREKVIKSLREVLAEEQPPTGDSSTQEGPPP